MTTEITFPGRIPGNNGGDGLLRMKWTKKHRLLRDYNWIVASATKNRHTGPVSITLTRYSTGVEMDYDNLVSTGKLLIDAIVDQKVIADDKQSVIVERKYLQEKVKGKANQKTVIVITDIE